MSTDDRDAPPSAPQPDAKDWTWVTQRGCPECGFDASAVDPVDVADLLRVTADEWVALLGQPREVTTTRPEPGTWSASEYGAHVRDVCAIYDVRLELMLTQDGPHYANWDQDATAIEERYDLQDPAAIAPVLRENAYRLADRFAAVEEGAWDRTGYRSDGASFTVGTFARYFIHDPVHHLRDAENGLAALRP